MGIFKTVSGSETLHHSAPVEVTSVEFNAGTRTIMAFCADGNTRMCRIDYCSSIEYARALYKVVKVYAELGGELQFTAMGNNSPDRWFCDANKPKVEEADDLTLTAYFNS